MFEFSKLINYKLDFKRKRKWSLKLAMTGLWTWDMHEEMEMEPYNDRTNMKTPLTLFHIWPKWSIPVSSRNSIHMWGQWINPVFVVNFKMCNCVLIQVEVSMLVQKNSINIQYSKELQKWHSQSEQCRLAKWLFANINVSKTKKKLDRLKLAPTNQSEVTRNQTANQKTGVIPSNVQ